MTEHLLKSLRVGALSTVLLTPGTLGSPADQAVAAFLEKLWPEAWGVQFARDESAMLMQELAPGVFAVDVSDGARVVAQGVYLEVLRLEERPTGVDGAVSAGLLLGSTGSVLAVFGLDVTSSLETPQGDLVVETLVPLGMARDAEAVVQGAYALHAQLDGAQVFAGDEPALEPDPCDCIWMYGSDRSGCRSRYPPCRDGCAAIRIATIQACWLRGPLALPCIASANTTYASCVAGCAATVVACLRDAADTFFDCLLACLAPRFFNH